MYNTLVLKKGIIRRFNITPTQTKVNKKCFKFH